MKHPQICFWILVLFLQDKFIVSLKFSTSVDYCHTSASDASSGKRFRKRSIIYDEARRTNKWNSKIITYGISEYTEQLNRSFVDNQIEMAFDLWAQHADLDFIKSIGGQEVDIQIKFTQGVHGDSTPFRSFDIAHAFAPDEALGGDIHFNDNFTQWHEGTTLLHTATHEIGHAIGLNHIPLKSSVMSPYQGHSEFPVYLSLEDIEAIQALYGKRPSKQSIPDETVTQRSEVRITSSKTTQPTLAVSVETVFIETVQPTTTGDLHEKILLNDQVTDKVDPVYQPKTLPISVNHSTISQMQNYQHSKDFLVEGSGYWRTEFENDDEDKETAEPDPATQKFDEDFDISTNSEFDIIFEDNDFEKIAENHTLNITNSSAKNISFKLIHLKCIVLISLIKNFC